MGAIARPRPRHNAVEGISRQRAARGPQRLIDQIGEAAADHDPNFRNFQTPPSRRAQGFVGRGRQVGCGVHEGAIQVKNDCVA